MLLTAFADFIKCWSERSGILGAGRCSENRARQGETGRDRERPTNWLGWGVVNERKQFIRTRFVRIPLVSVGP